MAVDLNKLAEEFVFIGCPFRFPQCRGREWRRRAGEPRLTFERKWGGVADQKRAKAVDRAGIVGEFETERVHRRRE
jgi:hypothetical protein